MDHRKLFITLIAAVSVLAACRRPVDAPVSSGDPTGPEEPAGSGEVVTGEANVESVEVLILESDPVQVNALVRGNLPDGCTEIAFASQTVRGSRIDITLSTARPADAICTEEVVPFERTLPVDVAGLAAGEYTVTVNGVSARFELEQDVPGSAGGLPGTDLCPAAAEGAAPYLNEADGYCFLYPEGFEVEQPEPGVLLISDPAGDDAVVLRPTLTITAQPSQAVVVEEVIDALAQEYPDRELETETTTIGGQSALVVANLPGEVGNRQAFVIWFDVLYTLTAQPIDEALPEETAAAEAIWSLVTDSLTFVVPEYEGSISAITVPEGEPAAQRFEDLGIEVMVPGGWRIDRLPGTYGLVPPDGAWDAGNYILSFSQLMGLPTGGLDALTEALAARFEGQGESDLSFDMTEIAGADALIVTGLQDACQMIVIPGEGIVRTVAISPDACDSSGAIAEQAVLDILDSITLFELGE